jgi:hypothetical protein
MGVLVTIIVVFVVSTFYFIFQNIKYHNESTNNSNGGGPSDNLTEAPKDNQQ